MDGWQRRRVSLLGVLSLGPLCLGLPALGATAAFTPQGSAAVPAGVDVVYEVTLSVETLSGFDSADVIVGADGAADLLFAYSADWSTAFSNVTTPQYDVGFYTQSVFAGGNDTTSVGTALTLGTVTIDTAAMAVGAYQVQIDHTLDGFSNLGLAGQGDPLSGDATYYVVPAGCGNNQLDSGEACDDGNNVPGDGCSPLCQAETPVVVAISGGERSRALSFRLEQPATATGGVGSSAIKITPTDLQNPNPPNPTCCAPPNFSMFEAATCTAVGEMNPPSPNGVGGCARWVGPAYTFLEAIDNPIGGTYRTSRLQCTPYYHAWEMEGDITVIGAEIAPSSSFNVQAYGDSCKGAEAGCANTSPAVVMTTRRAGDVAPNFNPPSVTSQPDALDVAAAVNKFKGLSGVKSVIQVQPNLPDANTDVNAIDISIIVDNVKGFAYPFSGPCVCPSTVPCNFTSCANASACTGPHGAGATCVKTCTSGPRTGAACGNNKHCGACDANSGIAAGAQCDSNGQCNGGTCATGVCPATGFCRDRCGRCN